MFFLKYGIAVCALISSLCLLVAPCGISAQVTREETVSIEDALGRYVEIRLPVERLVVLTSDALEMVRALGAKDRVVGINDGIPKEPLFWPELKRRPVVGRWNEPNYELIAILNPDIVISYGRWPGPELEEKLAPFGIQVVRLDFFRILSLERDVETLGRILESEREAQRFIDWHKERLGSIKGRLKNLARLPDVYIESFSDYTAAGPGSGGNEMCVVAGGSNIASDSFVPFPKVTPEWVLARNPDVIIKAASLDNCYAMTDPGPLREIRDKIALRPVWNSIRAVKEERVYVITSDIWTGPRAIIGIAHMVKRFHPDLFKDLDPEELHREYLERFQGIKYRGVYIYPCSK